MFAKLVTMIIALGVIGCGVLAQRHARLQAASEATHARLRIAAADDTLREMRAQVAAAVAPVEVQRVASAAGPLRPATNDIPRSLLAAELKGLAPVYDPAFAQRTAKKPDPRPQRVAAKQN